MKQLYTQAQVNRAARDIAIDLDGKYRELITRSSNPPELVFVGILKGGAEFMFRILEAARTLGLPYMYGFIGISRYKDTRIGGPATIEYASFPRISGNIVVLVDDIVDSGGTMTLAKNIISALHPHEIETVSLLMRSSAFMEPDKHGLMVSVGDFVVGSGMGMGDLHRDKKGIWVMDPPEKT